MSTLVQIRSNTLLKLAETSGGTWQDSEIDSFINREYEHLQTLINEKNDEYFGKVQTTSTTTNEYYSLPTDQVKILMIEIQLPQGTNQWIEIPKISIHERERWSQESGGYWNWENNNIRYYLLGDQYSIVPIRKTAGSNDLRVYYVYKALDLTSDSDVPIIPGLYHELLEIGATNRARRSIKEPPIDQDDYTQKIYSMLETVSQRVKHRPDQIRMSGGLY